MSRVDDSADTIEDTGEKSPNCPKSRQHEEDTNNVNLYMHVYMVNSTSSTDWKSLSPWSIILGLCLWTTEVYKKCSETMLGNQDQYGGGHMT